MKRPVSADPPLPFLFGGKRMPAGGSSGATRAKKDGPARADPDTREDLSTELAILEARYLRLSDDGDVVAGGVGRVLRSLREVQLWVAPASPGGPSRRSLHAALDRVAAELSEVARVPPVPDPPPAPPPPAQLGRRSVSAYAAALRDFLVDGWSRGRHLGAEDSARLLRVVAASEGALLVLPITSDVEADVDAMRAGLAPVLGTSARDRGVAERAVRAAARALGNASWKQLFDPRFARPAKR